MDTEVRRKYIFRDTRESADESAFFCTLKMLLKGVNSCELNRWEDRAELYPLTVQTTPHVKTTWKNPR